MKVIANRMLLILISVLVGGIDLQVLSQDEQPKGRALLIEQARKLRPLVKTDIANQFLNSVDLLPTVKDRVVYYDRENRKAFTAKEASRKSETELQGFARTVFDEQYYYFTRYGTPLAFSRPLEIIGETGVDDLQGLNIVDFGFGSIGSLRLLACGGANVTGIEIDALLKAIYSDPIDSGKISSHHQDSKTSLPRNDSTLKLVFGSFPSDSVVAKNVPGKLDLFISKNTLKRGYIHPEEKVDPKRLVHLGVSDKEFVDNVFRRLKPGGLFLIYNLHPAPAKKGEAYIPWADGRCPFDRKKLELTGFKIVEFDTDDTKAVHAMAKALGWEKQMNLENDLFATYTLLVKPRERKQQ